MLDRIRRRMTYANVMATVAVFIALGGASYAALKVPKHSVGTKQLKKHSVGEKNLKQNSVGPKSLQGNAVGPDNLNVDAVSTRNIINGSIEYEDIDPLAHVSSTGVLGESAGVVSATRVSKGQYSITFNRDLRGCVAVASVGFGFGSGVIGAGGTAQARMNLDNDPTKVGVTAYRGFTFADVADNDVNVIVAC
jgi:hypothetical protein